MLQVQGVLQALRGVLLLLQKVAATDCDVSSPGPGCWLVAGGSGALVFVCLVVFSGAPRR